MKGIRFLILTILVAIPVMAWVQMTPLADRFTNLPSGVLSAGRLCGIIGITLFAINIILTSRLKILDNLFWGLNKVYKDHHIIGGLAFSLLLFHPLALSLNLAFLSPKSAASFLLFEPTRIDVVFGKAALLLMMGLLVITFYLHFSYQNWKFTHKFLGVALMLAIGHTFLVSSDISQNLFLRFYLSGLGFLALGVYTYRSVFPDKLVARLAYAIAQAKELTPEIVEMTLAPVSEPLRFFPGQFVFVKIIDPAVPFEEHPFSISSSPSEKNLRLTIKRLGDYTEKLSNLKIGAKIYLEGPFGKFSNRWYPNKDQVWIAGGIGITPFLAMARSLADSKNSLKIGLFYSVGQLSEAIDLEELENIAKIQPNFSFFPYSSQKSGRLTADYLAQKLTLKDTKIFICGPTPMMKDLRNQLRSKGVENSNINTEEFELD